MDQLNQKILQCLQSNARLTHAELGRKIGISSPAVNERIKKNGRCRYHTRLSHRDFFF